MSAPLADIANLFAFNTEKMLAAVTGGLSGDDWFKRNGEANHAQWLVGHLAATRCWAVRLLGGNMPEADWEQHFGAKCPITAESDKVPLDTLTAAFTAAGKALTDHLKSLTDETVDEAVSMEFPDGSKTRRGAAHFLMGHEWYHLGQLGLIRRTVGKAGFA